jgi:Domain of unknown function (DUF3850)
MPTTHTLKTWPQFWLAVERGDKTFEVRKDDRAFQTGDKLILEYFDPTRKPEEYQGFSRPTLERRVTFVLPGGQFGIEPGYVVLGLAAPHFGDTR